jgi:hypothetical protein
VFVDAAQDRGKCLFSRKVGVCLNRDLRRGDHLIIADCGVAFGSLRQLAFAITVWSQRGIVLHLLDLQIDGSTPEGKESLELVLRVAEVNATIRSEITLECHATNRAANQPINQRAPLGFTWVGPRGRRELWENYVERCILKQIVKLRDEEHKSWSEISDAIEIDRATRGGWTFKRSAFYRREWSALRCRRAYPAAIRLYGPEPILELSNGS